MNNKCVMIMIVLQYKVVILTDVCCAMGDRANLPDLATVSAFTRPCCCWITTVVVHCVLSLWIAS